MVNLPTRTATSAHYDRIKEFMRLARQDTPQTPTMPSLAVRMLRAKLILEEAAETVRALGIDVLLEDPDSGRTHDVIDRLLKGSKQDTSDIPTYTESEEHAPNLVEIADGCADVSVVTLGTLVSCGIRDVLLFAAIEQNNLDKFGPQ